MKDKVASETNVLSNTLLVLPICVFILMKPVPPSYVVMGLT